MTLFVTPIVEGQTEQDCVKLLLSRVWRDYLAADVHEPLAVLDPIPAPRGSLVKAEDPELGERIEQAFRDVRRRVRGAGVDRGFILLLLDAEEDCPVTLSAELCVRATATRSDADIAVVLAKRQLENWFKAAATSLAGYRDLPADLVTPADPELGNGAGWLQDQMRKVRRRRSYDKRADAPFLVRQMNLHECNANSRSFRKLCNELRRRLPSTP